MKVLAASAGVVLALAGSAWAGPEYSSSDIVSHFTTTSETALGAPRALCIGAASECARSVPSAAPKPDAGAFNLRVTFEYKSDQLTREARANLDEFAKALSDPRLSRSSFMVEGHTDAQGGDQFNLDLSVRRAKAVAAYLEGRGVAGSRLAAMGYGKQRLLSGDPMASGNRRVETRLVSP